jgi:hypothetical protein
MPKRNFSPAYYKSARDVQNRKLNLAVGMMEKLDFKERFDEAWKDFEVEVPKDIRDANRENENVGSSQLSAPTSNPSRPRALAIGYNPNTNTLYVVFRDNTWWEYRNVPSNLWIGLKNSSSTGKYLRASGLDDWPDMGPANLNDSGGDDDDGGGMSPGAKAQLNYAAQVASRMQNNEPEI